MPLDCVPPPPDFNEIKDLNGVEIINEEVWTAQNGKWNFEEDKIWNDDVGEYN